MKAPAFAHQLHVRVAKSYENLSRWAADFILAELRSAPGLLLCASAGNTPSGTYKRLGYSFAQNSRPFRKVRVLQIDEWGGLLPGHPASCRTDLQQKLLGPLQISPERFAGFNSDAPDPQEDCARVSNWLAVNGPIDICLLGLGLNGHVAMNEPADEFVPQAHVTQLARASRQHGMLKGLAQKPRYGLTLGLRDIFQSRKILLLVSGETKRDVLARLLQPRISTQFPASLLWLHPNTTVICDRAAYEPS